MIRAQGTVPKHFPECCQSLRNWQQRIIVDLQHCETVMTMVRMACVLYLQELE